MPPRKPESWSSVREALYDPPMAMQRPQRDQVYLQVLAGLYPPPSHQLSEDCLFLNIWSPELGEGAQRPVMIWLHPGGFAIGAGSSPWSDGTYLARQYGVLMVSLNHRLGLFGHLYLGAMGGAKYAESGNVGLLDIVAALEWIHFNIAHFGGDRNNVTIFGESGGAGKVSALMAMPAAKGLFHKAIVQSQSWNQAEDREAAMRSAAKVVSSLRITSDNLDRLQQLSPDSLLDAAGHEWFRPVVAGAALPRHPFDPDAPAISAEVPMLIGTTQDEGRYYALNETPLQVIDEPTLRRALVKVDWWQGLTDSHQADFFIKAFRSARPSTNPSDSLYDIISGIFVDDALVQAERKVEQGRAAAFMYRFAWESPAFDGRYKSCHTFEVPFVFGTLAAASQLFGASPDPLRYGLAENMSAAWAAFAHTGDPNHRALPRWEPYSLNKRATMIFDYSCRAIDDPGRDLRLAFACLRSARMSRVPRAELQ